MKRRTFTQKIMAAAFITFLTIITVSPVKIFAQPPFVFQIISVNQVVDGTVHTPSIKGMNVTFSYFNPPSSGSGQFLNIYAQVPGYTNTAWAVMNVYLDVFPNTRVLTTEFSLSSLNIPVNTPLQTIELAIENSPTPVLNPSNTVQFISYTCTIDTTYMYDKDNGNIPDTSAVIPYTAADFVGTVQGGVTRGCNVPNMDLVSKTNPEDKNACAPTSVANSLSWIESTNHNIDTDNLTERQRMEEISAAMGRKKDQGVSDEQIIQGKITFIANHHLKLKVEYHAASGNTADDLAWLQAQYDAGQDIEVNYTFRGDYGDIRAHAVVLTGLDVTGKVPQISFKDDVNQRLPGGNGETTAKLLVTSDGHYVFYRVGQDHSCTINSFCAESYDPNAGTYTDPSTGNTVTAFCSPDVHKKCNGVCPELDMFYFQNQSPVNAKPLCQKDKCCDIRKIVVVTGTCVTDKDHCKGKCPDIYRLKSDAAQNKNPIHGKCDKDGGCNCVYDIKNNKSLEVTGEDTIPGQALPVGKLKIYPNPAVQKINIAVNGYEGSYRLLLTNILGEQVLVKTIELNGEEIYTIDVSSLANGVYMVTMINDSEVNTGIFAK